MQAGWGAGRRVGQQKEVDSRKGDGEGEGWAGGEGRSHD